MSIHLILILVVLSISAWIDYQKHRIPNLVLGPAIGIHLALWWPFGYQPQLSIVGLAVVLSVLLPFLVIPRGLETLQGAMGMGDIKLIAYLALFFLPYVSPNLWLLSISFFALIASIRQSLLARRPGLRATRIPLAPILFLSSGFTLCFSLA